MPRGDRTGPMGMGPMTGGGAGYCAGFDTAGFANTYLGRGFAPRFGGGFGGGRGWRHWYYATCLPRWARWGAAPGFAEPAPEQEAGVLKAQAEHLRTALEGIEKRLADLEAAAAKPAE